jgi:hypothetical protein
MRLAIVVLLLAGPAAAQDPSGIEARMNACMAGLDLDAIDLRAEAFAAGRDYEARIAELCAAGDHGAALAFAREVEAAFYAGDPEAARLRACIAEVAGEPEVTAEVLCDE